MGLPSDMGVCTRQKMCTRSLPTCQSAKATQPSQSQSPGCLFFQMVLNLQQQ